MQTIFLVVALCFDAACADQQIFVEDQFSPNDSTQCEFAAMKKNVELLDAKFKQFRVACRTQYQLESEGV